MKKNLTRIFSLLLAALTVITASATPLTVQKAKAPVTETAKPKAAGAKLQKKAPAVNASTKFGEFVTPQVRKAKSSNVFRSAANSAPAPVKAPLKVGAKAIDNRVALWGGVIYSDDASMGEGLYTVPTAQGQAFELIAPDASPSYGAVLVDNIYYVSEYFSFFGFDVITCKGYDVETGEVVYSQSGEYIPASLTYDKTTSTIYGLVSSSTGYVLTTYTFGTQVVVDVITSIAKPAEIPAGQVYGWNSIACDAEGQLWGIAYAGTSGDNFVPTDSWLYKIDKLTGALTLVGSTGQKPAYMTDCTFDTATGKLFWTLSPADDTGWLCEVNTTTGVATRALQFVSGEEVCGLVSPAAAAADNAPARVEDLKIDFTEGNLTGNVSFTAPSTLFDNTAASGAITYTVKANDEVVATGSTTYGASVNAEITLESGMYTFEVYVSNAAGNGPAVKVKDMYVGKDTPVAPEATASYDADKNIVTINWTAVTASVNGGYMNPAEVTYNVTRKPDGVKVATGTKATTATDQLPAVECLTKFSYEVVAVYDGNVSQAAVTSNILVGSGLVPPFVDEFADGIDGYTIIDSNGDNKIWSVNDDAMRMGYNMEIPMDDWIITPAIKLEAGKLYDVVADIWALSSSYPERIEVYMGKSATVAGMTMQILAPTVIDQEVNDPYKLSQTVFIEESGEYYIGVHGISDADRYYLYFDNLGMTAPRSAETPAAAADLKATPASDGSLTAEITFTTPSKTISGNALASLDKVELTRNGNVIKTWDSPATGTALSYSDVLTEGGNTLYAVTAYNAEGAGMVAEQSVYVGFGMPMAPENITLVETATDGVVTLAWDAVTQDVNGLNLPVNSITYEVYQFTGTGQLVPVSDKISETSYTFEAVAAGDQQFVQFAVFSNYGNIEGDGDVSPFMAVGTPYTDFSMTAPEDLEKYVLGTRRFGAQWITGDEESFQDVTSLEHDNFYFYMQGKSVGDGASLFTGKIALTEIPNPGMVFYCMPLGADDTNNITVEVTNLANGATSEVYNKAVNTTGPEMTWNKVTVDLTAYAGKTVQITISGTCVVAQYTFLDGWKLVSLLDSDIAVTGINAPAKVKPGVPYNVDVTIANEGTKKATSFSVELYANGELSQTKPVALLEPDKNTVVSFEASFSPIDTEAVSYTAKVVYGADEYAANNESETVTVAPIVSKLPAPADLAGASEDNAVKLTWSEPDLSPAPAEAITEDFEDGDAFSDLYGDWIFVDKDKSEVGGFQGADIPGIAAGADQGSFWVWDTDIIAFDDMAAHSGSKFLFALFRYDDGTTDDWAISPELEGSAQTVSFYAKSFSADYPEKIEVYYSTGSTDPSDFKQVTGVGGTVPGNWTLYKANLPEGAKRFAIRSCATGSWVLMVDDVTFIPADVNANLELKGYDVYRDGVKINDAVVEECSYVDANVENGKTYQYAVVAVYASGVSASSNVVSVLFQGSGIESVYGKALNISAARGQIIVTGAAGQAVAVYTVDGKTIFAGQGEAKTVIPAQQGIYVVKAGKTVKKVIVK